MKQTNHTKVRAHIREAIKQAQHAYLKAANTLWQTTCPPEGQNSQMPNRPFTGGGQGHLFKDNSAGVLGGNKEAILVQLDQH